MLASPMGHCLLSACHGRVRRNAVSPDGVRLSGAPGAPLRVGCSSANRTQTGKLPRHGVVAVPRVFAARRSALSPHEKLGRSGSRTRSGEAGEPRSRPGAFRLISLACGHTATHGGTQGVAAIADIWLTRAASKPALINSGPKGGRLPGRRAERVRPRRPRIMGRTISERHNRNPQRRIHRA
jgi:hypothetical protein